MNQTLGAILRGPTLASDDKPALVCDGEAVSYGELERRACRVANGLMAAGVKPGDRVAYVGKNSPTYFEYLIGAAKARAVMVPMNWRLATPEIEYLCDDARPACIVAQSAFENLAGRMAPHALHLVCEDPANGFGAWRDAQSAADPGLVSPYEEAALQLYTSGTTGRPKGAVLTHRSLFGLRDSTPLAQQPPWYRWTAEDVSLVAMPIAHISGTGWGLWSLMHGATAIVMREFDPHAVFELIVKQRITKIIMVPTAIQIVVRHPRAHATDFSFLKYMCYGGAPISPDLLREAMSVFGCGFVQMYGMTETSGTIVALPPEDHSPEGNARMSSVGVPLPKVEVKILSSDGRTLPAGETGEIATRSLANMASYFNLPQATAETIDKDGWLRTGDAGFIDADGYVYIRDRVKDMIISGGENVYPVEVENAIRGHPDVAEVAVIGVPHEKWGEMVIAIVIAKPHCSPDAAQIIAWSRERIAAYKAPKRVEFVDSLPRNATGKILRRELRQAYRSMT